MIYYAFAERGNIRLGDFYELVDARNQNLGFLRILHPFVYAGYLEQLARKSPQLYPKQVYIRQLMISKFLTLNVAPR